MTRLAEASYIRFVLDPSYEQSIRQGSLCASTLPSSTAAMLSQIDAKTLDLERRGRWFSLWQRAKAQLPITTARIEKHCLSGNLQPLWTDYFSNEFWNFESTLDVFPHGQGMEVATTLRDFLARKSSQIDDHEWQLCRDLAELEWHRFTVMASCCSEGNLIGQGQSNFLLFNAISNPSLSAEQCITDIPLHWGVYRDGSAQPLSPAPMKSDAIGIHPNVLVRLESFRLDRFHDSSTLYYTLGHEIDEIKAELNQLSQDYQEQKLPRQKAKTKFFEYDGNCCHLQNDYYFRQTPNLLDDDASIVFKLKNYDEELRIPLTPERLQFFRTLLPRLRPNYSFQQTLELLSEAEKKFVSNLLEAGYLHPVALQTPDISDGVSIQFIGHSCLLIESDTTRIVVDPLLITRSRPELDLLHVLNQKIDAIVISHPHWDHFNLDSLLHFPASTPILIPEQKQRRSIVNIDMQKVCEDVGFTDIRQSPYWEPITIGDITIRALPYFGENSGPDAKRDWMTYHIEVGGKSIVGLVDSCHDQTGDMDTVLRDVREQLGSPDILFAPSSGFYYSLSSYTRKPFYLGSGSEQYTGTPGDVGRWTTISGAKMTVPYANFHFNSQDVENDHQSMLNDEFRHGSIQELLHHLQQFPEGPLAILTPGDSITWTSSSPMTWKRGNDD